MKVGSILIKSTYLSDNSKFLFDVLIYDFTCKMRSGMVYYELRWHHWQHINCYYLSSLSRSLTNFNFSFLVMN